LKTVVVGKREEKDWRMRSKSMLPRRVSLGESAPPAGQVEKSGGEYDAARNQGKALVLRIGGGKM